jgi:hypothetical protein
MICRKTVTRIKVEANRRNSKRSTGPRTERGKRNAKFNAVTLGLWRLGRGIRWESGSVRDSAICGDRNYEHIGRFSDATEIGTLRPRCEIGDKTLCQVKDDGRHLA